ncbi:hypothetical protein BUALT_Bualt05G0099200 [Buddleja alternifolia]|uniref:ENTH domain-containing protein n=1 Tax=Buddleja alternifolia TaxID=168488 RepID=A0AAV6XJY1_9LAMI|nr:hypothetical protein BUALT_Bualt05G0099200 [Buddleja alternifolia]
MRLWKRASAVFKDQNSIWLANFSRRTALRHPDIEKSVIRATSHHHFSFDHRDVDRVCEWLRISPSTNLKPILWSISNRIEKSRSWIVALKGLYLMHNVANSRIPCVKKIGRLPFDLSNFNDGHTPQAKTWPFSAFIRAYYTFLDQKSTLIFQHSEEKGSDGFSIMQELVLLQKLQALIDLLMQMKPQLRAASDPLILDVMDGIIIEIYDIYSRICRGIAIVLMNIYSGGKAEATMALNVVQKATQQGEELSYYFEFCQEIGVVNASEFPVVDRIPEEGIHELEQIINGFDEWKQNEEKAIVVVKSEPEKINNHHEGNKESYMKELRTIITDKWEKFDEDFAPKNPFIVTSGPLKTYNSKHQELPDLISFL